MNDDFNTPEALSVLFQLSHALHKEKSPQLAYTLQQLGGLLGLLQTNADDFLQAGVTDTAMVSSLIEERLQARHVRDFARADAIRAQLLERGIELEDGASGTTWRVISNKPTTAS
jgi:cysteinyl-tRNA synthetase